MMNVTRGTKPTLLPTIGASALRGSTEPTHPPTPNQSFLSPSAGSQRSQASSSSSPYAPQSLQFNDTGSGLAATVDLAAEEHVGCADDDDDDAAPSERAAAA
eukprot:3919565-Rhodomonas_salina.1